MIQKKIIMASLVLFQLLFFNHQTMSMEDEEDTTEEIALEEESTAEDSDSNSDASEEEDNEQTKPEEDADIETKQLTTIELEKTQPITTSDNPKIMKIFKGAQAIFEESDDELEKMEIFRKNFHDIFTRLNNELDDLFLRANIKRGQSKAVNNNKK